MDQPELFEEQNPSAKLQTLIRDVLAAGSMPATDDLVRIAIRQLGPGVRDVFPAALAALAASSSLGRTQRDYAASVLELGQDCAWFRGSTPDEEAVSSIDSLVRASAVYRSQAGFGEMIAFMARFRDYSPYNVMLVRLQNPSCGFFATERDWVQRHQRWLIEDARPLLILAPMTPVLLVYPLDQTEGDGPLPTHLRQFARFSGPWRSAWLEMLMRNARAHQIDVAFKPLSSSHGGFATNDVRSGSKARIVIHDGLDEPSRFGVLVHELAHVLLGHLGSDKDRWWPSRSGLAQAAEEIEAEAIAHIVTSRFDLQGSSAAYLSRYLSGAAVPQSASIDLIAKVAGKIERMARGPVAAPKVRAPSRPGARA